MPAEVQLLSAHLVLVCREGQQVVKNSTPKVPVAGPEIQIVLRLGACIVVALLAQCIHPNWSLPNTTDHVTDRATPPQSQVQCVCQKHAAHASIPHAGLMPLHLCCCKSTRRRRHNNKNLQHEAAGSNTTTLQLSRNKTVFAQARPRC